MNLSYFCWVYIVNIMLRDIIKMPRLNEHNVILYATFCMAEPPCGNRN